MKVACDFCEKIANSDSREVKNKWRRMKIGCLEYLLCEECSDEVFNFIDSHSSQEPFVNDNKSTNADRIRNMSDEELAEFLCKVKSDYQWMEHEFPSEEEHGEWKEWLQSETE